MNYKPLTSKFLEKLVRNSNINKVIRAYNKNTIRTLKKI
jgi:hypothetical protein